MLLSNAIAITEEDAQYLCVALERAFSSTKFSRSVPRESQVAYHRLRDLVQQAQNRDSRLYELTDDVRRIKEKLEI